MPPDCSVSPSASALIGTRALVTRDIEPYPIVVDGNPAKPIRRRFADDEIAMLLGARPLFTSNRIADLHVYWRAKILTR